MANRNRYDTTASDRVAKRRANAAGKIGETLLSQAEHDALTFIMQVTGEGKATVVRRLIVDEAQRLDCLSHKLT